MEKIKVGVLGCTGAVGQKLVSLLGRHPFFEISELVASEKSAGMKYAERTSWREASPMPGYVRDIVIKSPCEELDARILFSGLDASVAGEIESDYAGRGYAVVSNSRNHRMDEFVPLVIPEVNGSHIAMVRDQETYKKSGGFIVTNPNCSTIVLALALYPIYRDFGVDKALVTTMQAISGGGYPGVPSMDILGNVVPHISGEEQKMETELLKIFGSYDGNHVNNADITVSASCNRVPVRDGHTMSVSFSTRREATSEDLIKSLCSYEDLELNLSPDQVVAYMDDPARPQPLLDSGTGGGMTVTVGNLRKCPVLGWKFNAFGHNTVRGAAGAAILNAELLVKEGFV